MGGRGGGGMPHSAVRGYSPDPPNKATHPHVHPPPPHWGLTHPLPHVCAGGGGGVTISRTCGSPRPSPSSRAGDDPLACEEGVGVYKTKACARACVCAMEGGGGG